MVGGILAKNNSKQNCSEIQFRRRENIGGGKAVLAGCTVL
jgi:hypothetical protein